MPSKAETLTNLLNTWSKLYDTEQVIFSPNHLDETLQIYTRYIPYFVGNSG